MTHETLGKRLRRLREAAGISQGNLALRAQVSRQTIINVERDDQGLHSDTAVRIAGVLDVSLDYLLTGKDAEADRLRTTDAVLRESYDFSDRDIQQVKDFIRALDAMQRREQKERNGV